MTKDIQERQWNEGPASSGSEVGIAKATEDSENGIVWGLLAELLIGNAILKG